MFHNFILNKYIWQQSNIHHNELNENIYDVYLSFNILIKLKIITRKILHYQQED